LDVSSRSKVWWYGCLSVFSLLAMIAWMRWGPQQVAGSYADDSQKDGVPPQHRQESYVYFKGRGVKVGHVEGSQGNYLPDRHTAAMAQVKVTPRSGPSKVNGHANAMGKILYSSKGLASGIKDVYCYTSQHWMGPGGLRAGSHQSPRADDRHLFTHNWIASKSPFAVNVLRRVDYLIDEFDTIMVVGVNNGRQSPVPALLASAYNVIAVGRADGQSSGGYTVIDGVGRCKPDVVAKRSTTSAATPVVASSVARLLEAAWQMDAHDTASRSEVIKAVIMAGAAKPVGWHRAPNKPLDEHLGAGIERFSYSYAILNAGRPTSGQWLNLDGWDFQRLSGQAHHSDVIQLDDSVGEVSIVLVWNRHIDGQHIQDLLTGDLKWDDTPRLADFNLRLVRLDAKGQWQPIAQSAGSLDNVEHVYLHALSAGTYQVQVERHDVLRQDWDYAIAWRIEKKSVDARP